MSEGAAGDYDTASVKEKLTTMASSVSELNTVMAAGSTTAEQYG
jgi:hypothetical protein